MADFFEEIKRLQGEINRSFGSIFRRGKPWEYIDEDFFKTPLADLRENRDMLIAVFEIPGVDKQDIDLNINEDNIEVRVVKKQESKSQEHGFLRQERSYKGFYKSMSLPCEVIPKKAEARYEDGLLYVMMPKSQKSKKNPIKIK